MPEYHLYVEARDNDGTGNSAQIPMILKIIDVNDNAPIFEKPIYEFILLSNLRNFTIPAYVKATDADAEEPNNVVRYEIISGNYENKFRLDKYTGNTNIIYELKWLKLRVQQWQPCEHGSFHDLIVFVTRLIEIGLNCFRSLKNMFMHIIVFLCV